ncbi:fas-binding factor 1 homolog [Cylas formicarius]|uniref:fas-binding factor 1 homolog n=1 Tax=Cylas formicarius TaxID=197179 RepID=UPI002958427E|nr:fas-binding factor 1 homolog [Cylas formicarius]
MDEQADSDDSFFDEPRAGRRARPAEKKSVDDLFEALGDAKPPKTRFDVPAAQEKRSSDLLDELLPRATKNPNLLGDGGRPTSSVAPPKRRGGRAAGVEDVLGLFGAESAPRAPTPATKDVPDWLGGGGAVDQKADPPPAPAAIDAAPADTKDSAEDTRTALSALQQQESLLLVSLQLKKHEDNLEGIRRQQEKILSKQEDQFETFLGAYVAKQQELEARMLDQQRRINDHIGLLVGASKPPDEVAEGSGSSTQRHQEELFLLEESYKKRLSLAEKSAEAVEERLNRALADLAADFEAKTEAARKRHRDEVEFWERKLKATEEKHLEDAERAKARHSKLVAELHEEYSAQIERLKETKEREADLTSRGSELERKLDAGVGALAANAILLRNLHDKVAADHDVLGAAREKSLDAKEEELELMRRTLDKCRETAETERAQLLGLIRGLEGKIAEQSLAAQEERWALRQAAATLAARSSAMDRELEFSRASIERERDQLKTLKETLLEERESALAQLTEERLRLAAERSRADVSDRLTRGYEIEKIKAEAEAAVDVARELSDRLNRERDLVRRQKADLDRVARTLAEKERELLDREADLEREASRRWHGGAAAPGGKFIGEAGRLENMYREKLAEVRSRAVTLTAREKKLTEDKLALSKERTSLYGTLKRDRCVLCAAEGDGIAPSHSLERAGSDPELMRLRAETLEDEGEVSREEPLTT